MQRARAAFYHFPDFSMRLKSIEFIDLNSIHRAYRVHATECLKHLRSTFVVVILFLFRQIGCAFEMRFNKVANYPIETVKLCELGIS